MKLILDSQNELILIFLLLASFFLCFGLNMEVVPSTGFKSHARLSQRRAKDLLVNICFNYRVDNEDVLVNEILLYVQ